MRTMEPRYNEPGYNEVPVITKYTLWFRQNYSNLYGTQPGYNEPRYNENPVLTNQMLGPDDKIYPDITKFRDRRNK